ncbi:MAG: PEP-CTERM sorting domain-containing protein [Phycisphaeraceae bacterium]|nr:PEP-CTERM sorting domain-containing protein [Phycisphaeraceae bacterium]
MRRTLAIGLALGLFVASGWASAALSGNLVGGGDFEDTSYLVNETSPRGILPHRFDQVNDLNRWIAHWGPPNNPGGLGGFSTYDDPRDLGETGGTGNQATSNLGNFNRSVDPTDANNHVMEVAMFRPSMTQWIVAPENQVAGPIHFSFDLRQSDGYSYDSWGTVAVFGMNYLPPDDVTFFRNAEPGAPGATYSVYDPNLNPDDGELIYASNYGKWLDGSHQEGDPAPPFEYFDTWQHYDTDEYLENEEGSPIEPDGTPDYQWWVQREVKQEITQTYAYYVVAVYPVVYDESDPYFWLYGGQITDNFVLAFDNFDFRVSVAQAYIPGDFNGDGVITLSDINPFKLALTDTAAWQAQFPDVVLADVDPNGDGVITLSDINPFKAILTGGVGADVPEPASLSLLAVGALAMWRRR